MPKPVLKDNDLVKILLDIELLTSVDKTIEIEFIKNKEKFCLIVIENK